MLAELRLGQRTYVVRRATRCDLAAIVRLLAADPLGAGREAYDEPLPAEYLRAFDAVDADPAQLLVVVDDPEGRVVGTLQLSFLPGLSHRGARRAQVEAVRVDERVRGSGVGRSLLEWTVAEAGRRGCRFVQLTSNRERVDAHRFYERLGFVASHTGFKLDLAPPR